MDRDVNCICVVFIDLLILLKCYFNSVYVLEVKKCLVWFFNKMVCYELKVVEYYYECEVYFVVVNCGKYVVEYYL